MLIQPYQDSWVKDFQQLSQAISAGLAGLHVSIIHVGSTAIPTLAAKPIIDIDLVYAEDIEFKNIKLHLENLGYFHNGNQGISDREVFKRSRTATHPVLDLISHHLYVCPDYSKELHKHLLFKAYLIEHADARLQYQQLKLELAAAAQQDRKRYAQLKEERAAFFFEDVLLKASHLSSGEGFGSQPV